MEDKKVYLRKTVFSDLEYFARWECDPAVTEFFTISEGRDYEEIATEFIERKDDDTCVDFTVVLTETDEPIGRIYISNINTHYDSMDITRIYIGEVPKRGLGLGEAALREAMAYGFDELGCERVTLDHFTANIRARNLYLKVGFKPEGCMRHGGKKNGEYVDLNLMSILKDEYYGDDPT